MHESLHSSPATCVFCLVLNVLNRIAHGFNLTNLCEFKASVIDVVSFKPDLPNETLLQKKKPKCAGEVVCIYNPSTWDGRNRSNLWGLMASQSSLLIKLLANERSYQKNKVTR